MSLNRIQFNGIQYTHFTHQFLKFYKDTFYFINPLNNKIFHIDKSLAVIDSITMEHSIFAKTNPYNPLDSIYAVRLQAKKDNNKAILNYSFSKEEIMKFRSLDSLIYRNEKLLFNGKNYIVSTKPRGVNNWNERSIVLIDSENQTTKHYTSILVRGRDFNKPIFVNSYKDYLLPNMIFANVRSSHFFDPTITDRTSYDKQLLEWLKVNDKLYFTLFLYQLIIDED